jgi:starvation-inducible DNA-binding protein
MSTTQNVKQFKDHDTFAQKGPAVSASTQSWPETTNMLNECLAHSIELNARIKQANWSARGENYYVFHKMADDFTDDLAKQSNKLSARISAIGGVPGWTPSTVAETSLLPEYPLEMMKVNEHLKTLAANYELAIEQLQKVTQRHAEIDDYVTTSIVTSFKKLLEEQRSFLLAHSDVAWLEKPKKQYA